VIFFGLQKVVSKERLVISLILENHGSEEAKTGHHGLPNLLEMESILRLPSQRVYQRKFLKFVIFLMRLVDV